MEGKQGIIAYFVAKYWTVEVKKEEDGGVGPLPHGVGDMAEDEFCLFVKSKAHPCFARFEDEEAIRRDDLDAIAANGLEVRKVIAGGHDDRVGIILGPVKRKRRLKSSGK